MLRSLSKGRRSLLGIEHRVTLERRGPYGTPWRLGLHQGLGALALCTLGVLSLSSGSIEIKGMRHWNAFYGTYQTSITFDTHRLEL